MKQYALALLTLASTTFASQPEPQKRAFFAFKFAPPLQTVDDSFSTFFKSLRSAVEAKDKKFIESITSDNISYDFGEDKQSKARFMQRINEVFWNDLKDVLNFEFLRDETGYCFPYFRCSHDIPAEINENFDLQFVPFKERPIFAKASQKSKIIGTASYEYVLTDSDENGAATAMRKVEVRKIKGFMKSADVKSTIDMRAKFEKDAKAQWKMVYFIGGD